MNTGLTEVSPTSFAKKAAFPNGRLMSAIVAPLERFDEVTAEVRAALTDLSISVILVEPDDAFSSRLRASARGRQLQAVLVPIKSQGEVLRTLEGNRSRLENRGTICFVLSKEVAMALQHLAPSLSSWIGTMWAAGPGADPPPTAGIDPPLTAAIDAARAGRYAELYEAADAKDAKDLAQVTSNVLTAIGDPRVDERAWRSFGFIGRAALIEAVPTILAHWPPGLASANSVRAALDAWLSSVSAPATTPSLPVAPLAPQALGEAMGVVKNAAQLLDRTQAKAALMEILDSIFEGYAIFPGSEDRRALFDWWLDYVVPEAVHLRAPPPFDRRAKSDSSRR